MSQATTTQGRPMYWPARSDDPMNAAIESAYASLHQAAATLRRAAEAMRAARRPGDALQLGVMAKQAEAVIDEVNAVRRERGL